MGYARIEEKEGLPYGYTEYLENGIKTECKRVREFFFSDAHINWHGTNEHFNVEEYIRANCEYPREWGGEIQRIERTGDIFIVVVHVYTCDRSSSFHVVPFMQVRDSKILSLDEYWGDNGAVPQWRLEQQIGADDLQYSLWGIIKKQGKSEALN
jgi:hypothetical protein